MLENLDSANEGAVGSWVDSIADFVSNLQDRLNQALANQIEQPERNERIVRAISHLRREKFSDDAIQSLPDKEVKAAFQVPNVEVMLGIVRRNIGRMESLQSQQGI